MNTAEQFLKIYEERDRETFLRFLKSLTNKDKRVLIPVLKKIYPIGYQPEDYIFTGTSLLCSQSAEEFIKLTENFSKNSPGLTDVLQIDCPEWFDQYLEEADNLSVDYTLLLEWMEKDFAHPGEKIIGNLLGVRIMYGDLPLSTLIEKYPIILTRHIWYIFEHYWYVEDKKEKLIHYIEDGTLDRLQVLRKSLTPNFYKLYLELQPLPGEIIQYQTELFYAMSRTSSFLVHAALQSIDKIIEEEHFRIHDFLREVPQTIRQATTKNVLNSILSVLQKVARKWQTERALICQLLPPVFIHKDERIQKKAAELLCRYGDPGDRELKEKISLYLSSILQSVKARLILFLDKEEIQLPETEFQYDIPESVLSEENRIKPLETFEDYLFYLSALPDSDESYMWEMLPFALQQFDEQITRENVLLFKIIFQQAYAKGFSPDDFFLFRNLYYIYLIEYGKQLQERYPEETLWMQQLYDQQVEKEKTARYAEPLPLTSFSKWHWQERAGFKPLYRRLRYIQQIAGTDLPCLSMPTHKPGWIDPELLIERLLQYQLRGIAPDQTDLELALARCRVEDPKVFLQGASGRLNETFLTFLQKWYNETIPALEIYMNQRTWRISDRKAYAEDYKDRYPVFIQEPSIPWAEDSLLHSISIVYTSAKDIPFILWSYPTLVEPLYACIVSTGCRFSQIGTADTRDTVLYAVQTLAELKSEIKEMTGLFLACTLLISHKNILDYGTAIWIEKTTQNKIDNELFGKQIGKLLNGEWGPAKRLIENIQNNLLNIDPLHNHALEKLLTNLLAQLSSPITHLNILLEIYSEVLSLNNSHADITKIPQLEYWATDRKLKTVVKSLLT